MNYFSLSDEALAELLTLTAHVDMHGTIIYCNHNGERHRVHGPAVIYSSGSKTWWLNGKRHRTNGPASEYEDGSKSWYLNGEHLTEGEWNERIRSI